MKKLLFLLIVLAGCSEPKPKSEYLLMVENGSISGSYIYCDSFQMVSTQEVIAYNKGVRLVVKAISNRCICLNPIWQKPSGQISVGRAIFRK